MERNGEMMEIKEEKTVDMLTNQSVSILTQKFIEINGVKSQIGDGHRCAYVNSETGRSDLRCLQSGENLQRLRMNWKNKKGGLKNETDDLYDLRVDWK